MVPSSSSIRSYVMILFAFMGAGLDVVEYVTIYGMIIVCWTIYKVYTGGFSDL